MPFSESLNQGGSDIPNTSASSSVGCGGAGTLFDPYQLCDSDSLSAFLAGAGGDSDYYILTANIALTSLTKRPGAFTGILNGLGHEIRLPTGTISGWTGLFALIGASGLVQELVLTVPAPTTLTISAGSFGFLAQTNYGTISNVTLQAASVSVSIGTGIAPNVGGLVGYNGSTGRLNLARIKGYGAATEASLSFSASGSTLNLGGLVGSSDGQITLSAFVGSLNTVSTASSTNGGLVGANSGSITTSFVKSSSIGGTASTIVGGFVGKNSGTITNSYVKAATLSGSLANLRAGFCADNTGGTISYSHAITGNIAGGVQPKSCFANNDVGVPSTTHNFFLASTCTLASNEAGDITTQSPDFSTYQTTCTCSNALSECSGGFRPCWANPSAPFNTSIWFFPTGSSWPQFYAPNSEP